MAQSLFSLSRGLLVGMTDEMITDVGSLEIDYSQVEVLAREVCGAALAEGWLTQSPAASTPLRLAVRRLADLLGELDGGDVPTLDDLLSFALTLSDEAYRASALADLVPLLANDQLDMVLNAATMIGDDFQRSRVLTAVAPRATPVQAARTLAAVLRLEEPWNRGGSLVSLVTHLDGTDRGAAIEAALDAIEETDQFYFLSGAVLRVAPFLAPAQMERVVAAGVALADEEERAPFLANLAEFLPARRLDETVSAVGEIMDGNLRAVTLAGLAPKVSGEQLAALVDAAYAIRDDSARARALAGVAPHLAEPQRRAAIDSSLAAVIAAPAGETLRGIALGALLPLLDDEQVTAVLDADSSAVNRDAEPCLGSVAPYAASVRLAAAFAAHIAPRRLGDVLTDVPLAPMLKYQLARVVPYLPAGQRNAGAVSAVSLLERVGDRFWALSLATLAVYLAPDQLHEVLRMADPHAHPMALSAGIGYIAAHLSRDQLDEALAAVLAIDEEPLRVEAMTGIAPYLDTDQIDQVITDAVSMQDAEIRADALATILPQVPTDRQSRVVEAALSATSMISSAGNRAGCLLRLAAVLPPEQGSAALGQAFTATTAMSDSGAQARMLARMAPLLPAVASPVD